MVLGFFIFLSHLFSQEPNGALIFRLLNYKSDVKLKKNVTKQLEHAYIVWSIMDNTLVITEVSQKYINLKNPKSTRLGEEEKLELPPGKYAVSCVGYVFEKNSSDIDKALSKNAFFNLEIIYFNILPGKSTEIIILPVYQKDVIWSHQLYLPDLYMKVFEEGKEIIEYQIDKKTEKSILWSDYKGPLKFD